MVDWIHFYLQTERAQQTRSRVIQQVSSGFVFSLSSRYFWFLMLNMLNCSLSSSKTMFWVLFLLITNVLATTFYIFRQNISPFIVVHEGNLPLFRLFVKLVLLSRRKFVFLIVWALKVQTFFDWLDAYGCCCQPQPIYWHWHKSLELGLWNWFKWNVMINFCEFHYVFFLIEEAVGTSFFVETMEVPYWCAFPFWNYNSNSVYEICGSTILLHKSPASV